jgi:hypothetical protein
MGTTITSQNNIDGKIRGSLNLGNACYHSVQSVCSQLLCKNLKIKIRKLYNFRSCFVWMSNLVPRIKQKPILRVSEIRVLRTIFRIMSEELPGDWKTTA